MQGFNWGTAFSVAAGVIVAGLILSVFGALSR